MPRLDLNDLKARPFDELIQTGRGLGVGNPAAMPRQQLIFEILRARSQRGDTVLGSGILEVLPDGFGFLRDPSSNFLSGPDDIYVSPSQIRRFNLRTGDQVSGVIRAPRGGEKYFALIKVEAVNDGADPESEEQQTRLFANLTPIYPRRALSLEHDPADVTTRALDLLSPVGLGQRALILAPPRTGRGRLLRGIAAGIEANHPDVHLIVLLIDARPEEVTEYSRALSRGEVIASTVDEAPARHTQVADMVHDRSCRLVEQGRDVVVLLDSITALARAWHSVNAAPGQLRPSGFDAAAMLRPRRLFAAARQAEEGGSLAVLAVALTDTGTALDGEILSDLRGAANQEIHLSAASAGFRSPALDPAACHTCHAERMLSPERAAAAEALRESLPGEPAAAMALLAELTGRYATNDALIEGLVGADGLDNQRPTGK